MDHTLIIGLGNPDPTLEETYHNVGALAVQWLAEHASENTSAPKFRAYKNSFTYTKSGTRIFIRPLVFMNESGRAVKEAMHAFDAGADNIIVIHDDSDLTVGDFKRAASGRSAGHKGIQSIIDHLGTDAFTRIRIGIREKDETHRKKAGDFVLSPSPPPIKNFLKESFKKFPLSSSKILESDRR